MAESGFIVCVPEAEARVGSLRERFDASAAAGVPAHITVLFPFMAPALIDDRVLMQVAATLAAVPAFAFTLERVARFPATTWLAPEPAAPFVALTNRLVQAFPASLPFSGEFDSVIPHLTVAHGSTQDADIAQAELAITMRQSGAIHARCTAVALMENSSGRFQLRHTFALADSDPPPAPMR